MECSRKDTFKEETKDIAYCVCVSALRTICRKYSATGEFEHELEMDAWKAKYTKCGWLAVINSRDREKAVCDRKCEQSTKGVSTPNVFT